MQASKKDYMDLLTSSMMNRLVDEDAPSLKDCYEQLLHDLQTSAKYKEPEEQEQAIAVLTDAYQQVRNELHEVELIE